MRTQLKPLNLKITTGGRFPVQTVCQTLNDGLRVKRQGLKTTSDPTGTG